MNVICYATHLCFNDTSLEVNRGIKLPVLLCRALKEYTLIIHGGAKRTIFLKK